MSGVQGPIETRTATTMATPADLAALDASPFHSGELAWVVSLATPALPALFVLNREDTSSIVNGTSILNVGPVVNQVPAVGRWKRIFLVYG